MEKDLGLSGMSVSDIDTIALEKGGFVGVFEFTGDYPPAFVKDLPGGWSAQWSHPRLMGGVSYLTLIPISHRARRISREGEIRQYVEAGLSADQARRVCSCVVRNLGLARLLAHLLKTKGHRKAIESYKASEDWQWREAFEDVLPSEVLDLSPNEIETLGAMIDSIFY